MMAVAAVMMMAAFPPHARPVVPTPRLAGKPIEKLGTADLSMVETTPVMWKGTLLRFESVRANYNGFTPRDASQGGSDYFRFRDVATNAVTPPFGRGFAFGSAFVQRGARRGKDTMWAFGRNTNATFIQAFSSADLVTWSSAVALQLQGFGHGAGDWTCFNNNVHDAREAGGHVMAIELGKPSSFVGVPFTSVFAQRSIDSGGDDLGAGWSLLDPATHAYTPAQYSACPTIRYNDLDDYYYVVTLFAYTISKHDGGYREMVVRSKDLATWEVAAVPAGGEAGDASILECGDGTADKVVDGATIATNFTAAMKARIAGARDINNSDMDWVDTPAGDIYISYSWGNQEGIEFLGAAVVRNMSTNKWLQRYFPSPTPTPALAKLQPHDHGVGLAAAQHAEGEALQRVVQAATALQSYYSKVKLNNMWGTGWWHDANNVEALAQLMQRGGANHSTDYLDVLHSVHARQGDIAIEGAGSTDDVGWWGLAWARAFELTAEPAYLAQAALCFKHMTKSWDDGACGGGLWWSWKRQYKNAITNELFLALAARLHALNASAPLPAPAPTYLQWAQREWRWFESSGMLNAQGLVNDGLGHNNDSTCANNGGQEYSYNQGVILGGLAWLYEAQLRDTGQRNGTLLAVATRIADATLARKAWPDGVLMEQCDADSSCNDDGASFKGIFARYLRFLADALQRAAPSDPSYAQTAAGYRARLAADASSLWQRDRAEDPLVFGPGWQGPPAVSSKRSRSVPTRSALDLLLTQL